MTASAPRRGPAHDLHVLVARLDRIADRILRSELGITYPRFLLLLTLHHTGPATQRALADELGLTEPTVSRTVAALAAAGLVTVTSPSGRGNRRDVTLTEAGLAMVTTGGDRLEDAFHALVTTAGVDPAALHDLTDRLLDTLGGPP